MSMESGMCACDFDGEPIRPCNVTYPRARKEHKCEECGEPILVGEQYERITGRCDGEWIDPVRTCMVCMRIRHDFCAPIGELDSTLKDVLGVGVRTGRVHE